MNRFRQRILSKLAQTDPSGNLPSDEVVQTKTVSGSPPTFIASDYYPIAAAFSTKNVPIINELTHLLNQALYYTSNGQVHLPWMKSVNFNFTTVVPSIDLRNLMKFSKQVYEQLYLIDNKPLSPEEIKNKIDLLFNSPNLNNLSSTNPIGQLAAMVGGNVKTLIRNLLLRIK